jgi:hypothetical protein
MHAGFRLDSLRRAAAEADRPQVWLEVDRYLSALRTMFDTKGALAAPSAIRRRAQPSRRKHNAASARRRRELLETSARSSLDWVIGSARRGVGRTDPENRPGSVQAPLRGTAAVREVPLRRPYRCIRPTYRLRTILYHSGQP